MFESQKRKVCLCWCGLYVSDMALMVEYNKPSYAEDILQDKSKGLI